VRRASGRRKVGGVGDVVDVEDADERLVVDGRSRSIRIMIDLVGDGILRAERPPNRDPHVTDTDSTMRRNWHTWVTGYSPTLRQRCTSDSSPT
jgi:hypothetical protein